MSKKTAHPAGSSDNPPHQLCPLENRTLATSNPKAAGLNTGFLFTLNICLETIAIAAVNEERYHGTLGLETSATISPVMTAPSKEIRFRFCSNSTTISN